MGVGKGRPQAGWGRSKGGDCVVPGGREAIEDEVEVLQCGGWEMGSPEEGCMNRP